MQNIAKLRANGFTVKQATSAQNCTEVSSKNPFYYFNPRFCDSPVDAYKALEIAGEDTDGQFRIIIAGECPSDNGDIRLSLVTVQELDNIKILYNRAEEAKKAATAQEKLFEQAMMNVMAA